MSGISLKNNNIFFRQLMFIAILVFLGVIIWKQLGFLLSCFLGAVTLYVLLRKFLFQLTEKRHWKPWMASLALIIFTTVVILGVVFGAFELIISEMPNLDTSVIIDAINQASIRINDWVGYPLISKSILVESKAILTKVVTSLLNSTYNVFINFFLMIVVLYFMLVNARMLEKKIIQYAPFRGESNQLIKEEIKGMIYSNAVGIPLIMLVQGIFTCFGYWITGVENLFFWGFLTAIFGLIPVVGTAAIWLPMALYLFFTGNTWQGVVLVLYGFFIISNADNACRLVLMKKMSNTHPLIVIFGVILGIPLFGFWGIIFGPLLISVFLLLLKIYFIEYGKKDREEKPETVQDELEKEVNIEDN